MRGVPEYELLAAAHCSQYTFQTAEYIMVIDLWAAELKLLLGPHVLDVLFFFPAKTAFALV